MKNYTKYRHYQPVNLTNRQWPNKVLTKAPFWCSVDLRDGNQALETPMNLGQKIDFFKFLTKMGFKEIEVGFPAASETEFIFTRTLIEENLIPDDVTIQVLTQARDHIISKTFEALEGVDKAVVHLYNSTSTLQRKVVFEKNRREIIDLALEGAKIVKELGEKYGREKFIYEYSPESFTGTELDYAAEICNEVLNIWEPSEKYPVIINLPATVEMSTPNIYADQIEYMCNHLNHRENVIVSIHPHNDRGTATAATELGLMAGADRVEGTLFGNGERTGNVDILNLAMNLYTQGVDPELDFSNMQDAIDIYERSTSIKIHPRHPYAGELVYTAFSGSHQDAIKKGMAKAEEHPGHWEVPYLPIDPQDVGRTYAPIIRINSQSGKGGISYILESNYGLHIPKRMQQDVGNFITGVSDQSQKELQPSEIFDIFQKEYVNIEEPVSLVWYDEVTNGNSEVTATITVNGEKKKIIGVGNGILDAFCKALSEELNISFEIVHYNEHSLEYGTKSRAITYIQILDDKKESWFGAGISSNIGKSSLRGVVSAVNKMMTIN